ncbi:MAG: protein kinase [Polyangiaceae bacterium]|nr:protein kinase [Polyangiaceae bacterium]
MDPSARIGTTLRGKWRIDRLLGTGGFAAVFAATHRAGKRVAIKVLHPTLSASAEVRRRFLKEAYAANAVEHPGVVGVSDDDITEDGCAFLVMDLLEGETVDTFRKRSGGRLDIPTTFQIATQTLDALSAAHEKGIVHRDLKPENLFYTKSGQVKILDFGIARFREPGDEATATQTGMTMGSPAFMAPEQARGHWSRVDARTDVYAIGATVFTLLTGRLVHGKGNLNETLIAAATRPVEPLHSVAPHIPSAICAVIDKALAFDQVDRYSSARDFQAAILQLGDTTRESGSTLPLGAAPNLPTATVGTQPLTPPNISPAYPSMANSVGVAEQSGTTSAPVSTPAAGSTQIAEESNPRAAIADLPMGPPNPPYPPVPSRTGGRGARAGAPLVIAIATVSMGTLALALWLGLRAPPAPNIHAARALGCTT